MQVYVFFEGDLKLKPGFEAFFRKLVPNKIQVNGIACGNKPIDRFLASLDDYPDDLCLVLLDADKILGKDKYNNENLQAILKTKKKLKSRVRRVSPEKIHFMVLLMESWFLTDSSALESVFGNFFKPSALPNANDIERVSKSSVWKSLENATNNKYHKTLNAPQLLSALNPEVVASRSRHCRFLIDTLTQKLQTLAQ